MYLDNTYGNNCRAVALSTVLKYYGYPLSEAMCFGLGGSYDFVCSDIEYGFNKSYTIVAGNSENDFFNISKLFDLDYKILQPSTEEEAKSIIYKEIIDKSPIIAKVTINKYISELPMSMTSNREAMEIFKLIRSSAGNHVTVINNIGPKKISLCEPNIFEPNIVSWKKFNNAMCPKGKTLNHPARIIHLIKPKKQFEEIESNMNTLIKKAIKNNMKIYLNSNGKWGGIRAIEDLSEKIYCRSDERKMLINAKIFNFFCDIVTGGGFYRRLYANFLKEANKKYLMDDNIIEIAKEYNIISKKWSDISKEISSNYKDINEEGIEKISKDIKKMYEIERITCEKLFERVRK